MNQTNTTKASAAAEVAQETVQLNVGAGYWDTTRYPIGGDFHRVIGQPLGITITRRFDNIKGCNAQGTTTDGRTVCFSMRD